MTEPVDVFIIMILVLVGGIVCFTLGYILGSTKGAVKLYKKWQTRWTQDGKKFDI